MSEIEFRYCKEDINGKVDIKQKEGFAFDIRVNIE